MKLKKLFRRSATNSYRLASITALALALFGCVALPAPVRASEKQNTVNMYMFWGEGCPHCAHAKRILEPYVTTHGNVEYYKYEVYYNSANQQLMQTVGNALGIEASGVPLLIVGDEPYVGFSDTTGDAIKQRLSYCSTRACPDSIASLVGAPKPIAQNIASNLGSRNTTDETGTDSHKIDLPFIGTVDAAHISLPALTVLIALLDGFNPCAMWALLFIITLLIGMHDRKRMWLYGTTFIVTSAIVYFIFMAAWLNLFMFIGHITWVRAATGLLALGVGAYYLYDWHRHKTGCAITGGKQRKATFDRLRTLVKEKTVLIGLAGVAVLAAAVNIVELACSAGLPVLYTGILSSAGLDTWQYYAYMLLYILFFMLDDMVVLIIAMTTLRAVGIESKYTRAMRLVGGILMCILGALLIFAPQVLMFG